MDQIQAQKIGIKDFSNGQSAFSGESVAYSLASTGSEAANHLLALQGGWHRKASDCKNIAGVSAIAILTDGAIVNNTNDVVTATGKGCTLAELQGMMNNCPILLTGLKVNVDDESQLDEEIQIVKLSPAGVKEIKRIVPNNYKNEANNNPKLISIDLTEDKIVLGPDTSVFMRLQAGRLVNLTWFYKNKLSLRDMAREANK